MSETLNEQLSALLDGELAPAETELLLKRLSRDAGLRQQLSRYSLIGDALRSSADSAPVSAGFAARISTAIEQETTLPAAALSGGTTQIAPVTAVTALAPADHRWWRSVGGFAVAATVAGLAVLVMQRPDVATLGQAPAATTAAVVAAQPVAQVAAVAVPAADYALDDIAPSYVTPEASGTTSLIPPAQLANYVIAHSEFGSPLVRRNVITGLVAQDPLQDAGIAQTVEPVREAGAAAASEGTATTP